MLFISGSDAGNPPESSVNKILLIVALIVG